MAVDKALARRGIRAFVPPYTKAEQAEIYGRMKTVTAVATARPRPGSGAEGKPRREQAEEPRS